MWPLAVIFACLGCGALATAPTPAPDVVADCWMKGGCAQHGDFDGDGLPDVALAMKSDKTGRHGILFRLGSGKQMSAGLRRGHWLVIKDATRHREVIPDLVFLTRWKTVHQGPADRVFLDAGDSAVTLDIRAGGLVLEYLGF
jgi:hypothetical protein